MKRILILNLLLFCNLIFADNNEAFNKGNELYKLENYNEALDLYKSILDSGHYSFELFFNIGNCYYKLGSITLAKLYYEKAKKIDSDDEELISNLEIVNSLLVDKIEVLPKPIIKIIINFIFSIFSYAVWGYLSIILSFLSFLFFILYRRVESLSKQKIYFILFLLNIFFSLSFLGASFREYNRKQKDKRAIVFVHNSYIKNEPKENSEDLFILHEGTVLQILDNTDEWVKIKLDDGKIGWIKEKDILDI